MKTMLTNNRGAALIEFAIVSLLMFVLVFGIIEFGLAIKDYLTLSQSVREGVRTAALGGTITSIQNTVTASAATSDVEYLGNIQAYYRVRSGGVWPSTWIAGTSEAVPSSEEVQVKVSADYSHNMVTGTLFGAGPIVEHSEMVMYRE